MSPIEPSQGLPPLGALPGALPPLPVLQVAMAWDGDDGEIGMMFVH